MPRVSHRDDLSPDYPPSPRMDVLRYSLPVGRWGETQIRVGYSLPIAFACILAGGWLWRTRPGNADLPVLAGILAASLIGGALFQALVRIGTCRVLGGNSRDVTLRAFGSWGSVTAAVGPRLILALAVPLLTLGMATALAAMPPHGHGWAGISLLPPELTGQLTATSVLVACVWVLTLQAAAQTLPLPGCHGREALTATVDLMVARQPQLRRTAAIRLALGITAIGWTTAGAIALWVQPGATPAIWPWLTLVGVACWVSRSSSIDPPTPYRRAGSHARSSDSASAGTSSADKTSPAKRRPATADRVSPLKSWQHWNTRRRLRAVRRREVEEAADDQQLDGILMRVHQNGLDSLSAADKAVLKRVSNRLRDRPHRRDENAT
ncbi:hypothetical protein UC8_05130 [Roseimaritima ulvae]|uniref:Uncharacterized protein n=2 Tax=Roseimaritima ulvae TaxID=980254 RepID=A0A5B9QNG8_9BACT|nr:hypothetical protein UC8_05130 [Roseimaritima ulvae]